jgi:hypothetical protein
MWQRKLTDKIARSYFSSMTYYRLAFVDKRVPDPEQVFTNDLPHLVDAMSEVSQDIMKAMCDGFFFTARIFSEIGEIANWNSSVPDCHVVFHQSFECFRSFIRVIRQKRFLIFTRGSFVKFSYRALRLFRSDVGLRQLVVCYSCHHSHSVYRATFPQADGSPRRAGHARCSLPLLSNATVCALPAGSVAQDGE